MNVPPLKRDFRDSVSPLEKLVNLRRLIRGACTWLALFDVLKDAAQITELTSK